MFISIFLCCGFAALSQEEENELKAKDYKDPDQFEKFNKRRVTIGAWQVHQLREGALVVRLKTNKLLIDELLKNGNSGLALEKQLEQFAINKNTMFAYRENFNFCKLYFIYSNSSDSLLNGTRQGIFLDTNLTVDPAIVMQETFYLLAERDYAYNSSIGFVVEDSARIIKERGNPVKEMAVIVKNKYGHQLKNPFPYFVKEKNFMDAGYNFPIQVRSGAGGSTSIIFVINRTYLEDIKNNKPEPKNTPIKKESSSFSGTIKLKKQFTYEKLSLEVGELNDNLLNFYNSYPKPDMSKMQGGVKPFLY